MSRYKPFFSKVLAVILLSCSVLYADQAGWLDRFMPGKKDKPAVGEATKPLVEPPQEAISLQNSFAKVVEAVKPAVVNIATVQITRVQNQPHEFFYGDPEEFFHRFFGDEPDRQSQRKGRGPAREFRAEGTGSGVIIDPDGFILTNNHVVQGADQLTVTMGDGKSFKGKVVGTDPRTDLAVIRIKGSSPFPFAPLGDSSQTKIGDWALAIGSPFGLEQTVTAGIISAIRQSLNIEGRAFRNLLQTDAAINRGNSGGPLLNLRGEVVGINTAIYAPTGVFSGIGFAIPVNDAKIVLKDLIEKGYVERSWLGVEIAEVDDVIAGQFGLKQAGGALVNQVIADSPAAKAGIKRGDVIVEFDGKKTATIQALQDLVSATPPGRSVKAMVVRDGKPVPVTIRTAVMPGQRADGSGQPDTGNDAEETPTAATAAWLGAKVATLNARSRDAYNIEDGKLTGIVVVNVPPESVAADAGLAEGDVIQAINRIKVAAISDLKKLEKNAIDPRKGMVMDVVRRGRSFYLSYKSLQ